MHARELTNKPCLVCGGKLVKKTEREFDPTSGPIIIGPGSRHQYHEVSHGYHCTNCGLKYEFPPKAGARNVNQT